VAELYPQYSKYLINERKDQLPIKGILTEVDEKIEMETGSLGIYASLKIP
jgi:hypothetical protein